MTGYTWKMDIVLPGNIQLNNLKVISLEELPDTLKELKSNGTYTTLPLPEWAERMFKKESNLKRFYLSEDGSTIVKKDYS